MHKLFRNLVAITTTALLMMTNANAESSSTLTQMQARGIIKVGMSTFVPWAMRNKQGELIGFEIDVAKQLAKDTGLKVQFIPTAWDGIIPSLQANKFDVIIGGMTVTPERAKSVLFSQPYSHSGTKIAVNKQLLPDVVDSQQLNSRQIKLAVRRGAVSVQAAKTHFPKAKLLQFDDEAQAFQEVLNGNAHGVIASTPKPEQEAIMFADTLYLPFDYSLSQGDEAFAVRLGEHEKQAFFNAWIEKRSADGWLQKRYNYWFTTLDWQDQIAK